QAALDELRAIEGSLEGRWRRRLVSGLAAVALTAVAGAGWLWWSREPPPGERLPVVVADVENGTGDPSLDALSGLLTAALEPSRRIDLVPRPRLLSLARQAGMGELPRLDARAARELARVAGAKVLLTTSARREGSGVLVEVRGTDPADDKALFTVAESGGAGEVAAVLDRLAEAVRRRLRERREDLAAGRSGVAEAVTASPEAARRYYQGIDCELRPSTFGKTSGQDCGEYFQQALAQDPAFPLAHYRLARLASWGGASPADIDQHLGPALRAASRLPGRDAALVRALEDEIAGRPDDAIRRYEEILARQPDDRDALISAGGLHYARSEWAAASTYYERITSADPGNDFVLDGLVRCLGSLGKRDALRALLDRVRSEPPSPDRTEAIVRGLVWLGEPERAVEAAQRAVAAGGGVPAESLLSSALLVAGRFEEAEALQRRRIASVPKRVPSRWSLAMILAGEGRQREALRVLDEAERTGEGFTASDHAYVRAVVAAATMEPAAVWREAAKAAASNSSDEPRLAVLLALLGDVTHAREIGAAARPGSVERDQLDALLVWRGGNPVAAQARLFAAEKRDPCPTAGLFPSHLLGEVASAAGDHRNVIGAAQRFGRLWPGGYWFGWASSRMLLLSARAHAALGERAEARTEVDRLLARLRRADPDLPLLGEARALRARL
ncbi:MAG TPA: tetratricopeptide repeat protein, partial [Anaeromyxobacteraceae bacterium]|nr:tetratricopeptide repeat protein [Anaeromyxobacteraceae bacterium]